MRLQVRPQAENDTSKHKAQNGKVVLIQLIPSQQYPVTSILTSCQLVVGISNNLLVIVCLLASLVLSKSSLMCLFQLFSLTGLAIIGSSIVIVVFFWHGAHSAGLRSGPIGGLTTIHCIHCQRKILQHIIFPSFLAKTSAFLSF